MTERNPVLLPEIRRNKPCCPKCQHEVFSGRMISGSITFTCHSCKNKWQGGLPTVPADQDHPLMPSLVPPTIQFVEVKDKQGHVLSVEELRTPPAKAPSFRGGAPIKDEGEI